MIWPTALYPDSVATFVIARCGFWLPGVVTSRSEERRAGKRCRSHGWSAWWPASVWRWVTVWVAVLVIEAPGDGVEPCVGVRGVPLSVGSVTVTAASVVFPSLVATIV